MMNKKNLITSQMKKNLRLVCFLFVYSLSIEINWLIDILKNEVFVMSGIIKVKKSDIS